MGGRLILFGLSLFFKFCWLAKIRGIVHGNQKCDQEKEKKEEFDAIGK